MKITKEYIESLGFTFDESDDTRARKEDDYWCILLDLLGNDTYRISYAFYDAYYRQLGTKVIGSSERTIKYEDKIYRQTDLLFVLNQTCKGSKKITVK